MTEAAELAAEAALVERAAAASAASPVAIPAVPPLAVPEADRPAGFSQPAGADGSTISARVGGGGVHPREASVALGCHRIDGVHRRKRLVLVAPVVGGVPVEPEQPGQADHQQHHHHQLRADMAKHVLEAGREQLAEEVGAVVAGQRSGKRTARDEYAREAEPETNRAARRGA